MTPLLGLSLLVAASGGPWAPAADQANRFDGRWATEVTCDNADGALGYVFKFPSRVADGRLHGEKGVKDEAGWFQLDGAIGSDGEALLNASGLVGASAAAVGQRPRGSAYAYHVVAKFTDDAGSGVRREGRACRLDFRKEP